MESFNLTLSILTAILMIMGTIHFLLSLDPTSLSSPDILDEEGDEDSDRPHPHPHPHPDPPRPHPDPNPHHDDGEEKNRGLSALTIGLLVSTIVLGVVLLSLCLYFAVKKLRSRRQAKYGTVPGLAYPLHYPGTEVPANKV